VRTTDQTTHIVGDHTIVRHTFTGETARDGKTNPVTILEPPGQAGREA
jgi:hypothetical protein